jgi:hypothetical protein
MGYKFIKTCFHWCNILALNPAVNALDNPYFKKLIAHGVTGGVRSRLSGGSFKSGFLGSSVSYGASWSGAYEAAGVSSQATLTSNYT